MRPEEGAGAGQSEGRVHAEALRRDRVGEWGDGRRQMRLECGEPHRVRRVVWPEQGRGRDGQPCSVWRAGLCPRCVPAASQLFILSVSYFVS